MLEMKELEKEGRRKVCTSHPTMADDFNESSRGGNRADLGNRWQILSFSPFSAGDKQLERR